MHRSVGCGREERRAGGVMIKEQVAVACSTLASTAMGKKTGPVLLSNSQAGQGRKFSQPRDHF